jgi:hypothetical protein
MKFFTKLFLLPIWMQEVIFFHLKIDFISFKVIVVVVTTPNVYFWPHHYQYLVKLTMIIKIVEKVVSLLVGF